jgi:alpha-mannosidase
VLNDCKYGVSVSGGSINLTLLKAPVIPDMRSDTGMQAFTYALYPYNGAFADGGAVQNGYELNTPVYTEAGAAGEASLFEIAGTGGTFARENVILETVKLADDGSGDLILRLYESQNSAARCTLRTALRLQEAWQTDMKEEGHQPLECKYGSIGLSFRPFEVKTVRVKV